MMQSSFSKPVSFGTPMPKSGITKFSAKLGDTRIRILSTSDVDFILSKTHYLKGVGSFHCFQGSCCSVCANAPEGESNTSERAILPIAIASPSIQGGTGLDFAYLALPASKYDMLVSLNNNVGDVTSYDILIQCTEEGFQKYTFLPLVGQASLIRTPDKEQDIQNFLNLYRATIHTTLGKDMTEATFQAARAKALAGAAQSVGVNYIPNNQANQVFAQPQPMPALPTYAAQPQAVTVETPVVQPQPAYVPPVVETAPVQPQAVTVETPVVQPQPVVEATVVEPASTTEAVATEEPPVDWSSILN